MQSPKNATSPHNGDHQLRRSACDRCRGQKLRCERQSLSEASLGDTVCRRCHRAGAVCITSNPLRPGRPRLSHTGPPHKARNSRDQTSAIHRRSVASNVSTDASSAACSYFATTCNQADGIDESNALDSFTFPSHNRDGAFVPGLDPAFDLTNEPFFDSIQLSELSSGSGSLSHETLNGSIDPVSPFTTHFDTSSWDLTSGNTLPSPRNAEVEPEPATFDRTTLCRQFSELSHAVCIDASMVQPCSDNADEPFGGRLGDGLTLIIRAVKSAESFRSLLEKLRNKTTTPAVDPYYVTPASSRKSSDNLSRSSSTVNFTNDSSDHSLDKILALHTVTCYLCLHRIFKTILTYILSALLADDGRADDLILPDIQFAGFPFSNIGHLRLRLFVEACMHVMATIYRLLELEAGEGPAGSDLSGLLKTALGKSGSSQRLVQQSEVDLRSIRELCTQISSAIERRCYSSETTT